MRLGYNHLSAAFLHFSGAAFSVNPK